jgi:hypothetical protein
LVVKPDLFMPPKALVYALALERRVHPARLQWSARASPAPNPHPVQALKLKISVERGSEVNGAEVQSLWVVGNLGCAHLTSFAGSRRFKQVEVAEHVEKSVTVTLRLFSRIASCWTKVP